MTDPAGSPALQDAIRHQSGHRGRASQRSVLPREVVRGQRERGARDVHLQLLAERVQTRPLPAFTTSSSRSSAYFDLGTGDREHAPPTLVVIMSAARRR